MKLTGELKDKVEAAETQKEKKDIIAQAGMELTDDELESVAGGMSNIEEIIVGASRIPFVCRNPKCEASFYFSVGQSMVQCPTCKKIFKITG